MLFSSGFNSFALYFIVFVYCFLQKGEFKIFGVRTGEFLTPAEGAEAAKELQPTGQYDSIRTCDIYVRSSCSHTRIHTTHLLMPLLLLLLLLWLLLLLQYA